MTGSLSPSLAANQTQVLPPALQSGAQLGAFQGIQGLTGQPMTQVRPGQANVFANQQMFNPFAPQATAGAEMGAQYGGAAATNQFNLGGTLESLGQQVSAEGQPLIRDANQVMKTAMDPQQALYQRTLQQQMQQFQAMNAGSGVGSTPYAAGLDAQNLQNFNISWQAQQLANQVAGINAASGAYGTAGTLQQTGASISGAGAGLQAGAGSLFMQSAMYPYATSMLQSQQGMQALQQLLAYGQAGTGMGQQQISDYMSLLGLVPAQQQASTNAALAQNTIQSTGFQELAQLATGAGKAVGGGAALMPAGSISSLFGTPSQQG